VFATVYGTNSSVVADALCHWIFR